MIVAIDGPAGGGKSSVARTVATSLGFEFLNSGSFYRAVTWKVLESGADPHDTESVIEIARNTRFDQIDGRFLVDGEPRSDELRSPNVDAWVATLSAVPEVRAVVNDALVRLSQLHDVVVEGRDMTTTVFPHADVKIFLDASLDARAERRYQQDAGGRSIDEIREQIAERDDMDRKKPTGALVKTPEAVYLDTSDLTIEEVCARVSDTILRKRNSRSNDTGMGDRETQSGEITKNVMTQQELQEEFLKTIDELEVGQLVEGTVVQVNSENVFVDIGYKSEGRVPIEEFDELPKPGETVNVVLLSKETKTGGISVSKKKADEKLFWKTLKQAFQDHEPVEGVVARVVKGGFEIRLAGDVRGFNPISKMDLHRIEEPDEYLNMKSMFYVERVYSENRVNIILSRRAWLEEEVERKKKKFFETVQIGDDVEGVVKSFTSFGAFVDLGGFDGLLHINDMSWGHVTRPKDHVKKGEVLTLKVIRMDPEEQKINLSLRHMSEDPWNHFEEKFQVDQVVTGTVTKLTDFGAFIELEEGIEGLAHISELSWVKRISHPRELLKPGDEIEAKILDFDVTQGRVSLGLKQVLPNPWESVASEYPEGMRLTRVVKKITNTGAFVELEEGIDAFLHIDDLSWTKKHKHPSAVLQEGQEIECIVLAIDPEDHNIRVGIKQLEEDPWDSLKKAFPEGSKIDGEITNITDFGIFVRVQGGIEGLINKSNLVDPRVTPYEKAVESFSVGDKVTAVVTELSPSRQRLGLSIRELERKEQRDELKKYIHNEDNEATFTLGDVMKDDDDTSS